MTEGRRQTAVGLPIGCRCPAIVKAQHVAKQVDALVKLAFILTYRDLCITDRLPSIRHPIARPVQRSMFVRSTMLRQHFHTTNHSSDHPEKAFVMNQRALDEQLPAFQEVSC